MRRSITITNNGAASLVQYRTVRLVLNHAALVASKRSRADARDIAVSYGGVFRPVHVRFANTAATEVFWSLAAAIAPAGSDTYTFHIGALDRDSDLHPVPMRSKSQWDLEVVSPGFRSAAARNQPFAIYDGFRDTLNASTNLLEPLTAGPGVPSGLLYDPTAVSSWSHPAPGLVSAASGSGSLHLTWRNFSAGGVVRVRTTLVLQSGFTIPGAGALAKAPGAALTGYIGGVGPTASTGLAARIAAAVVGSSTSAALARSLADQTFAAEVSFDGAAVAAVVDGVSVAPFADTTYAANTRAGIWTSTTGSSGGVGFLEAWAEVWDGVADGDISISAPALDAQMPCPGLPGVGETLFRPAVASQVVVLTRAVGPQMLPVYELAWPVMDRDDYWELQALWHAQRGGAGSFSWTPPKGLVAELHRFVPGSLELQKLSATHYAARVSVERVVQ